MSVFSTISGGIKEPEDEMPPIDEAKMEKAMEMLARDADKIDENDPRQAATLMRKLSDAAGLGLSSGMEAALNRLEKGEDPDKLEEEMGDLLEGEEPFILKNKGRKGDRRSKPQVDEKLYDL
jgi:hypothetical protein